MELRVLNYFLMVAREENITRAANLLHVTQPTLSRQLIGLEQELGVKLFERSSHSITLTDDGMLLKRRAQEMVSLAEKTKQEFAREETHLSGEISIGCGELLGMNVLAAMITSFRKEYPMVRFDIFSGNADSIKGQLENGTLDMGLLMEPVDIGKYEFIRNRQREQWVAFVKKDSKLAKKKAIAPEDLAGVPLLMPKRGLVLHELSSWFGDYADGLEIVSTMNLQYNSIIMVKQGAGVLLSLQLENQYEGVVSIPLSPSLEMGSVLAWKKNKAFSPAISEFITFAKKFLNNQVEEGSSYEQ